MKYLIIISMLFLIACESEEDKIKGQWGVADLTETPLSITNYNDVSFNISSMCMFDGEKMTITDGDSVVFISKYKIDDYKLVFIYSDYGIPLEIEKMTSTKLILSGGGFGNTDKERSRFFRLEFDKVN